MGTCMITSGVCLIQEQYLASFILMLLFFLGFNIGSGSVSWVYLAEVTVDKASGFCAAA